MGSTLLGCGASQDPAAADRLTKGGLVVLKTEGKAYGLNTARKAISAENAADIAKLGHLKNLDFTASELTDDILKASLKGLNPISVVLNDTAITDGALSGLSGFARIEAVFMSDTGITDEGLRAIGGLSTLTEVNLDGTKITNDGLAHLNKLSNLKRLVINNTSIDDTGLEHLKPLKSLSKLDAKGTSITPAGVKMLGAAIPGLLVEQ